MAVWLIAKAMGVQKEVYTKWKILKELQEWMKLELYQMHYIATNFLKK